MHIHFHLSPTTHLAVVRLAFAPSQLTQLNDRSFACNLLSPSAVSPLQLTTSAHPFPAFTFRLPPSSGLSTPVSRGFLFLPCILQLLSSPSSCTYGYSAFCSSFRPSIGSASQWLSQRPALASRLLQIFPFHPVWFPIQSFRFCLFSLLFVSFRSSLLRSHSRSTGARFSPLRLLRFLLAYAHAARFLSYTSGLEHFYSASVSSFPFIPVSPHSRYSGAHLSAGLSACLHA